MSENFLAGIGEIKNTSLKTESYYDDFENLCKKEIIDKLIEIEYDFYGQADYDQEDYKDNTLKNTIPAYTLCLDIRKSTELMSYCESPKVYTDFMEVFIRKSKEIIKDSNAIYDKFTGDGILCHFIEEINSEPLLDCIKCSVELHNNFKTVYSHYLKKGNFILDVSGAGIGIGIDYGKVFFRIINHEFFAIGLSVVHACRLSGAPAYKTYFNTKAYHKVTNEENCLYKFEKQSLDIKGKEEINIYNLLYGTRITKTKKQ